MKNLAIAAVLGLAIGWAASLAIGKRDMSRERVGPRDPLETAAVSNRLGVPPPARAISALSLNRQRLDAFDGRPFSPYRAHVFSRDLLDSLSVEQVIEAVRAGQITDETEIRLAFSRVAGLDPRRALELLPVVTGVNLHEAAKDAIMSTWASTDPDGLLDYTRALPPSQAKAGYAYGLAQSWMESDPAKAMGLLAEFESLCGSWKSRLAESMLAKWAELDLGAAEEWVENNSEPARRDALRDTLVAGHLRTLHGPAAIDFVLEREDNQLLQSKLTVAFQDWATADPEAALERFVAMPKNHAIWDEIEQMGRAAMLHAAMRKTGVGKILTLNESIGDEAARRRFLLGAANVASSNDLEVAKIIIAGIPESDERKEAVRMFTELHMRKDPVALSEWLTGLEKSPSRDEAVATFVRLLIKSDPERAHTWAETIDDERTRARWLKKIREG